MGKPVKREPKKPYAKPSLEIYGTIRELTEKIGLHGNKDGGIRPQTSKTHV
jgi:hypothetical protein